MKLLSVCFHRIWHSAFSRASRKCRFHLSISRCTKSSPVKCDLPNCICCSRSDFHSSITHTKERNWILEDTGFACTDRKHSRTTSLNRKFSWQKGCILKHYLKGDPLLSTGVTKTEWCFRPLPAPRTCAAWLSFAATEDALFGGALVCRAEADEESRLFIFLLLLQAVVSLPFRHFSPQVRAWRGLQAKFLLDHLCSRKDQGLQQRLGLRWTFMWN